MKANITVTLKRGVLDPQGNAVMNALNTMNGASVKNVRVGKLIEIEIDENSPETAKDILETMCEKLLANPVIEDYNIELLGDA
ncbi:Phosphoribosylformylglycinamidine synthase, PurS subunit [hydrothermal vent metagenome]|uniref:Phosphoribosylformylglycinamidine synthase, PurS subunit n=1 Tax=hydrothermal vent metagenome TaxID=652676 RepID=A0A3B1CJ04_9ZZZZ